MNPFFIAHGDVDFKIPGGAFARFDQSEPVDPAEAEEAVFRFSAVSADWFEQQDLDVFRLNWTELFDGGGNERLRMLFEDAFERMPLFIYEISIEAGRDGFRRLLDLASNESRWIRIFSDPNGAFEAEVFGNLFGAPQTRRVSLHTVDRQLARNLNKAFDMKTWPDASEAELKSALSFQEEAVELAAFDVGQGSASALLDSQQIPWLYHDLGAGVTRNASTTPLPLEFCWTGNPTIVLSHWDSDHWAGARKDPRALVKTWIAPRQAIGPTHTAFANDILQAGGQILVWPQGMAPITVHNATNQSLTVGRCTGNNRNGSCLALRVDDDSHGSTLHWLLTGDGGYHQLPFGLPGEIAAMIAPHHGAKMAGFGRIPQRGSNEYARLLFSFGPGNAHGSTSVRHPTQASVQAHQKMGWDPGTWVGVAKPGDTIASADVLATAKHTTHHLDGVVAGWTNVPVALPRPCGNSSCTADIRQS